MGKENDLMLDYLRDNERFADLFNGSLFEGKQVVKACDLEEAGENYTEYKRESNAMTDGGHCFESRNQEPKNQVRQKHEKKRTVPRTRDLKKRLGNGAELRILAVEGQSYVDYAMPWRCMNYDALEYGRQVKAIQRKNKKAGRYADKNERLSGFSRSDRIPPVYTVCLYHGVDPWDGPRSLRDMVSPVKGEQTDELENFFADYPMNLICVNELEDFSGFTTGLKELFALMACRKDKRKMNEFLQTHEEYKRLDEETAEVISGIMGVENFMKNKDQYQEEGKYNMCQAIREMWEDGLNEGISRGLSQGLSQGLERGVALSAAVLRLIRSGISDNEAIASRCKATVEEVINIRKVFEV